MSIRSCVVKSLLALYLLIPLLVVSDSDDPSQKMLQLVAMASLPAGSRLQTQDWERGLEILPGARVAVQEVNRNTSILPGYQLELVEIITEGCNDNLALVQLIQHLYGHSKRHSTVGVIGPLCNEAMELVAGVTSHHNVSLVQIAAAPSEIEKNKRTRKSLPSRTEGNNTFPLLFQMLPLSKTSIVAALHMMKHFGWGKVGVLCSLELDKHYRRSAEHFESAATENGVEIVYSDTVSRKTASITMQYLQESGAKIVIVFAPPSLAKEVMCVAHTNGLSWPDYAWIFPAVSSESLINGGLCDSRNLSTAVAMEGVLTLELDDSPVYAGESKESNLDFRISNTSSTDNDGINPYRLIFYDAVWAFALALNESISAFEESQKGSNLAKIVKNALLGLSFLGAFGRVEFGSDHNQKYTNIQIRQIKDGSSNHIGCYVKTNNSFTFNINLSGDIPNDIIEEQYQLSFHPVHMFLTVVITLCILFTTLMFVLYIRYHGQPEIKASSTSISLFMFLGCYLQLFSALTFTVKTYAMVAHSTGMRVFVCNVDLWMCSLGLILILGTLFAKMLRIYRVFTYFGRTGWLCSDGALCILILCLVLVELVILVLWTSVDTYHLVDIVTYMRESKPPFYEVVQVCKCEYLGLWGGLLFGYGSILLLALLILAVKTRKIRRGNFKDTKKVNSLLLSYVVMRTLTTSMWLTFRNSNPTLSNVSFTIAVTLTPLFCQIFLFLPKTFPPLWRHLQSKLQLHRGTSYSRNNNISLCITNIVFVRMARN